MLPEERPSPATSKRSMTSFLCPCPTGSGASKLVEMTGLKDAGSESGDEQPPAAPETLADKAKSWLSVAAAPIKSLQESRAKAAAKQEKLDVLKAGCTMKLLPEGRGDPQNVRVALSNDGAMLTWSGAGGSGVMALSAVREVKPILQTGLWASLGSGFNHYGAFPYLASLMGSPHDLGKHVAKNMVKNGMASGWACLLANSKKCTGGSFERGSGAQLSSISPTPHRLLCASLRRCTGGIFGDTFKKIYDSIDVLIGGGPLILDKSTGYDAYKLYKYNHTVPIYIFYATVCDNIDVTVQSRVPLPGLKEAMAAAVKAFADAPERAPSEAKLSSLAR